MQKLMLNARRILTSLNNFLIGLNQGQWKNILQEEIEYSDIWYGAINKQRLGEIWRPGDYDPSGRFDFGNPMLYLTSEVVHTQTEKIEKYRERSDELLFRDPFDDFLISNQPIIQVKLCRELRLFDLRRAGDGRYLSKVLKKIGYQCDVNSLVDAFHLLDQNIYCQTQRFAELLGQNGFDGILYNPVRQPSKITNEKLPDGRPISTPEGGTWTGCNLALYHEPIQMTLLTDTTKLDPPLECIDPKLHYDKEK